MEAFLGTILLWSGSYAPPGWMFCHGQQLPITRYDNLYRVIGAAHGGDGKNTFALPDLRSHAPNGKFNHIICVEGIYPMPG